MSVEVVELLGQNVGIRNEVKLLPSEPFLHLYVVVAKTVLASDLITLGEVIDPLELIQALVQVALARASRPEHVPLV